MHPNQKMTDYKEYSLNQLENWIHDAISSAEATPEEIYNTIKKVVEEQYYYYKHQVSQAYDLLCLLEGTPHFHVDVSDLVRLCNTDSKGNEVPDDTILKCDKNDPSPECKGAWNDFWESDSDIEYELREAEYYNKEVFVSEDGDLYPVKDEVVKWQLPVEVDGLTGDCYVQFPDDLLEAANLKEGDQVEWIDNSDGTYTLKKYNVHD